MPRESRMFELVGTGSTPWFANYVEWYNLPN